ncbi:hypothetical protein [Aureibaculum conchae]|uniref:hypothetical protein n=1 Tax=Aureibaculum sp. 2308TA14-22 TaxID=3108392 RepID=UPI0033982F06
MIASSDLSTFIIPEYDSTNPTTITNDSFKVSDSHFLSFPTPSISISLKFRGSLSYDNYLLSHQIKSFRFLEENWDQDGAKKIPSSTIDKSISVLKQFNEFNLNGYLASPGPNEEVLILFKNKLREMELIIYPDKIKFVKFENNKFIDQGNYENFELQNYVRWLE